MKMRSFVRSVFGCLVFIFIYFATVILFTLAGFGAMWSTIVTNVTLSFFFYEYSKKRFVSYDNDFNDTVLFVFLAFLFVLWLFAQVTATVMYNVFPDASYANYEASSQSDLYGYVVLTLLAAPIFEEILYRGIIYRYFRESVGRIWGYILSSVVFALMHGTIVHIPIAIMGGLFFAVIYEYTGLLRASIMYHIMFNFLSLFVAPCVNLPDAFYSPLVFITADAALIICTFLIARLMHTHYDTNHIVRLPSRL